jgi:hypothetical protein
MVALVRTGFRCVVVGGLLLTAASAASAAGALAIGSCAAYGYAYDYADLASAEAAAKKKCSGVCDQVVTTVKGCVAFAVDGRKPCGPHGFANGPKLSSAQNAALKFCYKYGGKDCMIRAWICDGKS